MTIQSIKAATKLFHTFDQIHAVNIPQLAELIDREAAIPSMLRLLTAASGALRSYQHGNSAPDLAEEVANSIDELIQKEATA